MLCIAKMVVIVMSCFTSSHVSKSFENKDSIKLALNDAVWGIYHPSSLLVLHELCVSAHVLKLWVGIERCGLVLNIFALSRLQLIIKKTEKKCKNPIYYNQCIIVIYFLFFGLYDCHASKYSRRLTAVTSYFDLSWGLFCSWDLEQPGITWQRMNENKNKELVRLNGIYKKLLDGANVEYYEGFGKIIDAHTVDVDGKRYTVNIPYPLSPLPLAQDILNGHT